MFEKLISMWRAGYLGNAVASIAAPLADEYGAPYAHTVVRSQATNSPVDVLSYAPADTFSNANAQGVPGLSFLMGFDGVNWDRVRALPDNTDGQAPVGLGALSTLARLQGFNGVNWDRIHAFADSNDAVNTPSGNLLALSKLMLWTGAGWDRQRTAQVFKTALVTAAGSTAIWTPAAGKKFRLMGYYLEVLETSTLAVAGIDTLQFLDAAATMGISYSPFVPAAALASAGVLYQAENDSMQNGIISAAANNSLNLNLSAAFTAGGVRINIWGTEE